MVPSASVVIPAYNARETIRECLAALSRQTFGGKYEVIVVDDDSTDETGRIVREMGAKCFSIRRGGPAKARNLGIEKARGEIVLFTDADCIPAGNWIEKITEPLRDDAVAGVKGVYRTRQRELTARFAQYEYEEKYDRVARDTYIDFVDTYSAAYKRSVLVENGGFNTSFPIATGEDAELSFRLAEKGYKMVFQPEAIVYHVHVDTPWRYFKRKFKQPYWRIEVVRRHPRKIYRDSHTPQSQKLQLFLFYPILLGVAGVVSHVPGAPTILLLSLSLFMISAVSLTTDVLKKDRVAGLFTPLFLLLRASAYGFGLVAGIVGFLYRNTVGKGKREGQTLSNEQGTIR